MKTRWSTNVVTLGTQKIYNEGVARGLTPTPWKKYLFGCSYAQHKWRRSTANNLAQNQGPKTKVKNFWDSKLAHARSDRVSCNKTGGSNTYARGSIDSAAPVPKTPHLQADVQRLS